MTTFLKKGKLRENEKLVALSNELKHGKKFVRFNMNMPRTLHQAFRKKAFLEDRDMKDILMEKIKEYMST